MWFKLTLFALEAFAFVYNVIRSKEQSDRLFFMIYGPALLIGYAHYIMGWF